MQSGPPPPATGGSRQPPIHDPDAPRRVTLLELFFDLVFVVALALISRNLVEHPTWTGALHMLIALMALWWVWATTALMTDLYDPQRPEIKVLVAVVMFGALLLTTAIPEAFGDRGPVFAYAYVGIHLIRGLFLVATVHRDPEMRIQSLRTLVWFVISSIPWITGGLLTGDARLVLWAIALAVDYGGSRLSYPVPRLGRVPRTLRDIAADHLSERYQQFFIIALGDAVLVTGAVFSANPLDAARVTAFTLAFGSTLLLWRLYVHKSGELLPEAIRTANQPNRFLLTAPYTHLLMVAGVVTTASGIELVLIEPDGRTPPAWAAIILGGPALFLVGRAAFEYEVFSRVSWSRPGGLLALLTLGAAALFLSPLATLAFTTLVLAGVAVVDAMRSHGRPPETPRPPH